MTYKQAIKQPKDGWAHANEEQNLAALARALGSILCLEPGAIFGWAKRHCGYRQLLRDSERLTKMPSEMELLLAVLNDMPLEETGALSATTQGVE